MCLYHTPCQRCIQEQVLRRLLLHAKTGTSSASRIVNLGLSIKYLCQRNPSAPRVAKILLGLCALLDSPPHCDMNVSSSPNGKHEYPENKTSTTCITSRVIAHIIMTLPQPCTQKCCSSSKLNVTGSSHIPEHCLKSDSTCTELAFSVVAVSFLW